MTAKNNFTVRFWGVRGSYPVPGPSTTRYGGNTPCVEVRVGGHTIILDAGTGIIGLGKRLARHHRELNSPIEATLLFSHLHRDHTQGFPFFTPAYIPTTSLHIFTPDIYEEPAEDILVNVMAAPTFPVSFHELKARKTLQSLKENQIIRLGSADEGVRVVPAVSPTPQDEGVYIRAMRSYGHPQGVMIYRIECQGKSVVYATDSEGYQGGDQRLAHFARHADLLIHDAQYTEEHYMGRLSGAPVTQGFGHSTATMACETAVTAEVGQLVLFHHDPNYDDATLTQIEQDARMMFPNIIAAREGLMINLQQSVTRPIYRCVDALSDLFKRNSQAERVVAA